MAGSSKVTSLPNFYDAGGEGTSSNGNSWGGPNDDIYYVTSATYSGFAAGSSYSALNLVVYADCTYPQNAYAARCAMDYSTNGGSTWTTVFNATSAYPLTRSTIALSAGQDLTQLKVRYCMEGYVDVDGYIGMRSITGYDIRTEGTLGGSRRRQAVVVH